MELEAPVWIWFLAVRAAEAVDNPAITPEILVALLWVESTFKVDAYSSAGAMGLAQLMPGTAAMLGVWDPWDPWQSVLGGATYLDWMMDQFGDLHLALQGYNSGPGCVCAPMYTDRVLAIEVSPPAILERIQ